jgi:hypothetical protein
MRVIFTSNSFAGLPHQAKDRVNRPPPDAVIGATRGDRQGLTSDQATVPSPHHGVKRRSEFRRMKGEAASGTRDVE